MTRQRYHRVPTSEEEAKRNKRKRSEAAEHIATKIQALAWVAAGGFVMYQTDLPNVMMRDPNVNRVWFNIAAACFAMNCVLCFYLAVWLPYVQRIHIEWSVYCPRVIPTMTIVGVMCSFSFDPASLIRGLWPVWGLLTPLILALTFMACIMSLHFIPWPLYGFVRVLLSSALNTILWPVVFLSLRRDHGLFVEIMVYS